MTDELERAVLARKRETIAAVVRAGGAAAAEKTTGDPQAHREALKRAVESRALAPRLLDLLETAADCRGTSIAGEPVPAPPYLAITSRGPLCRGTLATGGRLIVRIELFAISSPPRRYQFRDPTPATALVIELADDDS